MSFPQAHSTLERAVHIHVVATPSKSTQTCSLQTSLPPKRTERLQRQPTHAALLITLVLSIEQISYTLPAAETALTPEMVCHLQEIVSFKLVPDVGREEFERSMVRPQGCLTRTRRAGKFANDCR